MRAPFTYYGGKAGLASKLIALFPPHRVYIEPYFGSGAVLFAKPPVTHEIVNDLDDAVVTFFRVLRERPDDLAFVCAVTPYARTEYELAHLDSDLDDDLERARRFWVRVNQSFAKTAGRRTGWSVTTARTQSPPLSALSRLGRFEEAVKRLARVSIEHCDGADLIARLATADTLVYADPPYVATARNGRGALNAEGKAEDYRCEMSEADHERLAQVLRATDATVFLSGYPTPLYEDLYGDWWHTDFAVHVHSSNAVRIDRNTRVERVWCNRAPDLPLVLFNPQPKEEASCETAP